MTGARAKAIEDKVKSLLSELPLSIHETWLLPQAETLCVIRYLEESHGAATSSRQDGEDTKCQGQEEGLPHRGKGVPSFDEMVAIILEEVDFDDLTTNMRGRRALAIAKPTPRGY